MRERNDIPIFGLALFWHKAFWNLCMACHNSQHFTFHEHVGVPLYQMGLQVIWRTTQMFSLSKTDLTCSTRHNGSTQTAWLDFILRLWTRTGYIISLCLGYPMCKTGIVVSASWACCEDRTKWQVRGQEQGLANRKPSGRGAAHCGNITLGSWFGVHMGTCLMSALGSIRHQLKGISNCSRGPRMVSSIFSSNKDLV